MKITDLKEIVREQMENMMSEKEFDRGAIYRKTIFDLKLTLRIAKEGNGEDRFTKEEIMESIQDGTAVITKGSFSNFITRKKDGKIMAVVNDISI
jgi:hypothetical protein